MYIYSILYVLFEEYAKKRDRYCSPFKSMTAITFSDAKTECSESASCHMFFDWGTGNEFYACANTASIEESGLGSILYQKQGNNSHTQF